MNTTMVHIDLAPIDGCQCPEDTYGVICVKCNKCGRFDAKEETRRKTIGERISRWLEKARCFLAGSIGCATCKNFRPFRSSCAVGWIQGWFFFPDPDFYTRDTEYPFTDVKIYEGWKNTRNRECDYDPIFPKVQSR